MPVCFICKKGNLRNLQVSHSKHRTKKIRRPNLHSYKMVINGRTKKVKLCTKCLRKVKKENKPHLAAPQAVSGEVSKEKKEK